MKNDNKELQLLREIYKFTEDCGKDDGLQDGEMAQAMGEMLYDIKKMIADYFIFGDNKGE